MDKNNSFGVTVSAHNETVIFFFKEIDLWSVTRLSSNYITLLK